MATEKSRVLAQQRQHAEIIAKMDAQLRTMADLAAAIQALVAVLTPTRPASQASEKAK